jgi:hypothetical protein
VIANPTKGALLGVAVATAIALLQALAPVGGTPELASWFRDDVPHRLLSTFLYALPLAILFGVGLGRAADDLWGGVVQRVWVLGILAVGYAAVASALAPALTGYALGAAAAGGIGLAWWAEPVP